MDPRKGETPEQRHLAVNQFAESDHDSHSASFDHEPVMVEEVVDLSSTIPSGMFVDTTLGGAGHAVAVLGARPDLTLIGIDQDADARQVAAQRLEVHGDRVQVVAGRFDRLAQILRDHAGDATISGFLFDLGVSSPQLDRSDRGFSFRNDGPLDMRMDRSSALTADEVVNGYDETSLGRVLRTYGDERFASRIAASIVASRPVSSTGELAAIIVQAIPAAARRSGGHPAKRSFQAIRIEVNDELGALQRALEVALDAVCPGGRLLVLTYHSGEDRIVKSAFRDRSTVNEPPGLPVEVARAEFSIVRPAVRRPSSTEEQANPRARSARLRVVERVAA